MEAIMNVISQMNFSITLSQVVISAGILALGLIWGRFKAGALLSLASIGYWSYAANQSVLMQVAAANMPTVILTGVLAMITGFCLLYVWHSPSSR